MDSVFSVWGSARSQDFTGQTATKFQAENIQAIVLVLTELNPIQMLPTQ